MQRGSALLMGLSWNCCSMNYWYPHFISDPRNCHFLRKGLSRTFLPAFQMITIFPIGLGPYFGEKFRLLISFLSLLFETDVGLFSIASSWIGDFGRTFLAWKDLYTLFGEVSSQPFFVSTSFFELNSVQNECLFWLMMFSVEGWGNNKN